MLVVIEPAGAEVCDGHRVEAEGGGGAGRELTIDLGGEPAGGGPVRADPRPPPPAVLVVAKVLDLTAGVAGHLPNAEREGLRHVILGEPSRHKVPQTLPQIGGSEDRSERQRPARQPVVPRGPTGMRRGRDSNPRYSFTRTPL